MQRHHHRSEYWVVVSGTAKVRVDDKEFYLSENQSTFIPSGCIHTLENPGKIDLEMIEVRSGQYLGMTILNDCMTVMEENNMEKLTCFKAYDIRGKLGEELNEDIAYRIGRAYGEF